MSIRSYFVFHANAKRPDVPGGLDIAPAPKEVSLLARIAIVSFCIQGIFPLNKNTRQPVMYDYDAHYRRLKTLGQSRWHGRDDISGDAKLTESIDRLASEIFPKPPATVLELGCGTGLSSSRLMAQKGYAVSGIDISEIAIATAIEHFRTNGLAGSFRQGSVCSMPFLDDSCFDIVIDGSCLHCLIGQDRQSSLAEVLRVLRPDGTFIVSSMCGSPKSADAKARFDADTEHLMENGAPYRTLKQLPDLVQEMTLAGFVVQDTRLSINPWWDHVTMVCKASYRGGGTRQ